MAFLGGLLVRMLLSLGMLLITPPCPMFLLLFYLSTKKRRLTEWTGISCVPLHMGFSPSFIGWVNLFYSGVQSAVNVNGHISDFFALEAGLSPVSSSLCSGC